MDGMNRLEWIHSFRGQVYTRSAVYFVAEPFDHEQLLMMGRYSVLRSTVGRLGIEKQTALHNLRDWAGITQMV
jgi:hypothetical protein